MNYVFRLLAAVALGIYSGLGRDFVMATRPTNQWGRLLYSTAAVAVLVVPPMLLCAFVLVPLDSQHSSSLLMQQLWFAAVFLTWLSVTWAFIIRSWRSAGKG